MRVVHIIRIFTMILALVVVIAAIRGLDPSSVQRFFDAIGIEPGAPGSPGLQPSKRPLAAGEKRVNICPNRIHAVKWADGRKVEEVRQGLNLRWKAYDPEPREIGYMDVEKWLSLHCQTAGTPIAPEESQSVEFRGFVEIEYIDGKKLIIEKSSDNVIRFGQQASSTYRSEDLVQSIRELETLARFQNSQD